MRSNSLIRVLSSLIILVLGLSTMILLLPNVQAESYSGSSNGLPTTEEYNYVTFGDVNNDDDLDIAYCGGGYLDSRYFGLFVSLGDGYGEWTDSSSDLPTTGSYGVVELGDLNNDGNLDLIAGHDHWARSDPNGIVLYLGDGEGGWSKGSSPYTSEYASQLLIEDINDDNNMDIIAATQSEGIKVWLGDGTANTWTESSDGLPDDDEYTGVTLGDIDGDGHLDMAATDYNGNGVHLYQGDGNGKWTDKTDSSPITRNNNFGIDIIDFNKDGHQDLIVNSQWRGISAFTGNSDWSFSDASSGLPINGEYGELQVVDIDQDSYYDIVTAGSNTRVEIYKGGTGAFSSWTWTEASDTGLPSGTYYGCAVADIDHDGDEDIAGASWGDGVSVWLNDLNGNPVPPDDDDDDPIDDDVEPGDGDDPQDDDVEPDNGDDPVDDGYVEPIVDDQPVTPSSDDGTDQEMNLGGGILSYWWVLVIGVLLVILIVVFVLIIRKRAR